MRRARSAWSPPRSAAAISFRPNKLPYTTPTHWVYDTGEFVRLMDKCIEASDWKGYAARARESKKHGKLRGRAVSYYIEFGGIFNERMEMRFDPSGALTIYAGTHSHGQGHATVFAQIVHEWLGVPFESIRYVQGDTAQVAIGRGTYGARCGRGRRQCAASRRRRHDREGQAARRRHDGGRRRRHRVQGRQLPGHRHRQGRSRWSTSPRPRIAPMGPLTGKFGIGLEADRQLRPAPPSHPNGCHVCEVEVDPETGAVTIDRYFVVDDLGRVLNPMIVRGQIHGGVVQGIGQALMEHQVYDRDSGPAAHRQLPGLRHAARRMLPSIEAVLEEVPCKTNPLGVKGIGESGTIGAPPTVINAIIDALAPLGVTQIDMPATPLRVWEAIEKAKAGRAAA